MKHKFVLYEKSTMLRKHIYTPDFVITWKPNGGVDYTIEYSAIKKLEDFSDKIVRKWDISFLEIKGGFSVYNNHREFSINQKWMMDKYEIFVQKIVVPKFFHKTFFPQRYKYTDSGGRLRKIRPV